jgi:hypothetical protein
LTEAPVQITSRADRRGSAKGGACRVRYGQPASDGAPVFSPDGCKIAFEPRFGDDDVDT